MDPNIWKILRRNLSGSDSSYDSSLKFRLNQQSDLIEWLREEMQRLLSLCYQLWNTDCGQPFQPVNTGLTAGSQTKLWHENMCGTIPDTIATFLLVEVSWSCSAFEWRTMNNAWLQFVNFSCAWIPWAILRKHLMIFEIRGKYNILDGTSSSQVSPVPIVTVIKQTAYLELDFSCSSWCSLMLCSSGGTKTSLLMLLTQLFFALFDLFWLTSAETWNKNIVVSHMFKPDFLRGKYKYLHSVLQLFQKSLYLNYVQKPIWCLLKNEFFQYQWKHHILLWVLHSSTPGTSSLDLKVILNREVFYNNPSKAWSCSSCSWINIENSTFVAWGNINN